MSQVAGLRLVGNTLEFLDSSGTPQLRVNPPYLIDSDGDHFDARLALSDCAFDTNPAPPWGRTVISPQKSLCSLSVSWSSAVAYPILLDPAWTTTGSPILARTGHRANLLPNGNVLISGGGKSQCEIYNPATGTFSTAAAN